MARGHVLSAILILVLILPGCMEGMTKGQGTVAGGAIGAATGAAVGAGIGAAFGSPGWGAVGGSILGSLFGSVLGYNFSDDDTEKLKTLSGELVPLPELERRLLWAGISSDGKNAIMNEARSIEGQFPRTIFGFDKDGNFRYRIPPNVPNPA